MKYELVNYNAETGLFQIQAVKSFWNVEAGDLGGWVSGEHNLSQYGDCWIYDYDSVVVDSAIVSEYAQVYSSRIHGNAKVSGWSWITGSTVNGHSVVIDSIIRGATVSGCARIEESCVWNAAVRGNCLVVNEAVVFSGVHESSHIVGIPYDTQLGERKLSIYQKKVVLVNEWDIAEILKGNKLESDMVNSSDEEIERVRSILVKFA